MGNLDLYRRAARSQKELAYFGIGLAAHRRPVDLIYAVTISQPGAGSRRILKGGTNIGVDRPILSQVADRGADSEIFGTLVRPELLKLLRVEIVRVRIEHAKHARY